MNSSTIYILIALIAFAIIAIFTFWNRPARQRTRLSTLASIAFVVVIAGFFFGEDRWIGYGLIGAGVLLAIADIIRKSRVRN